MIANHEAVVLQGFTNNVYSTIWNSFVNYACNKTVIMPSGHTALQLRHSVDNTQSFLVAGCGTGTQTILSIVTRYRNGTDNPTVNCTSLGQINTAVSLSSGSEKYVQVGVGAYFQGFVISNRGFITDTW